MWYALCTVKTWPEFDYLCNPCESYASLFKIVSCGKETFDGKMTQDIYIYIYI